MVGKVKNPSFIVYPQITQIAQISPRAMGFKCYTSE
jgi:hypothetical protein